MSQLMWNKAGIATDADVMQFMAGEDVILDREIFAFDIRATAAHAEGLALRGYLSPEQAKDIHDSLMELHSLWQRGEFVLDERYEDCHSAIESFLIEKLGEVGGRVHLGRSRNDQILVATRMYMQDSMAELRSLLVECAMAALKRARQDELAPMPGYTHLQRAVPSSVGLWMASFAEAFAETAELAGLVMQWIDACPLGAVAGYGVNLPLARDEVAEKLGFSRVVVNPMAAQASRGKHEHLVVSAMWQAMQDVRRLAWDISLFSTKEFGFVRLPAEMTTGSSIMPNKRNPDLVELLRASSATVGGCLTELQEVLSLPSGYHRDLQITKPALVRATKKTLQVVSLVPRLLRGMELNLDRMREAIDPEMMATDKAVELSSSGMSFREAYRQVADTLGDLKEADVDANLAARVSPGACADLRLDDLGKRIIAIAG